MLRISDEQWELIRKHFAEKHYPDDRSGRKLISARKALEAVLWILNTGAQWHMLPQSFPNTRRRTAAFSNVRERGDLLVDATQ